MACGGASITSSLPRTGMFETFAPIFSSVASQSSLKIVSSPALRGTLFSLIRSTLSMILPLVSIGTCNRTPTASLMSLRLSLSLMMSSTALSGVPGAISGMPGAISGTSRPASLSSAVLANPGTAPSIAGSPGAILPPAPLSAFLCCACLKVFRRSSA